MVQIAIRAAFTRYAEWLRRRGGREYVSFVERSEGGHWHVHNVLRASWLDSLAMDATGRSWRELTETAARLAERGGSDPLAGPLGWLRDAALACGLAPFGFQLAPSYAPLGLTDYVTEEMRDGRGALISTVIGVKRVTYTTGFFDRPPDPDPCTVPRARRDATKRNAPGGSDVDNG